MKDLEIIDRDCDGHKLTVTTPQSGEGVSIILYPPGEFIYRDAQVAGVEIYLSERDAIALAENLLRRARKARKVD